MEIKILAALGNEKLLQLLNIGLAQVAFLSIKQIGPGRRFFLPEALLFSAAIACGSSR